jgi:hypothetical protein
MKYNDKVKISITGEERSKNEIVYNNIIENLKLTEEEQVKYLKNKVTNLEIEMHNKMITILLILLSIIGLTLGIGLIIMDIYILGILFVIATFVFVAIKFYLMYKKMLKITKSMEFDKIEHLRDILNMHLK